MLTELSWPWHVDEFGPVFLGITVVGDRDRKQFMRVYVCVWGGSMQEDQVVDGVNSFTGAPPGPTECSLQGRETPVSMAYWKHKQSQQSPTMLISGGDTRAQSGVKAVITCT